MGFDVVGLDNFSTGLRQNIPSGVDVVEADAQSCYARKALESHRYDAILHIAGQSSGEKSWEDPVYDIATNTTSTLGLLELAREQGCRKFIYASSMSVYGDPNDSHAPVSEMSPLRPLTPYSVGKTASESYLQIFAKNYAIQTTSLRLFNVYGPGQNLDNLKQGMVSIFIKQALSDGRIIVKGPAKRFRDQVYIDDVVNAFVASVFRKRGNSHEAINVCTGRLTTVGDVIRLIEDSIQVTEPTEYQDGTRGDQEGIIGDPRKARELLDFEAVVTFSEGFGTMLDWAKGVLNASE
jgi:UDP-glucose 4-epimerase